MRKKRPFVLGLGGTTRDGSSTERVLRVSLAAAEAAGAQTAIFAGSDLGLPMYQPGNPERDAAAERLIGLFRRLDGIIIATPAYHGSLSGVVKNALDYTEDLRADERIYFDGCAIGCICCAAGWQAGGPTLIAMRSIAHALRGWPTPFGAIINTSLPLFGESGQLVDESTRMQLALVGRQVAEFAQLRLNSSALSEAA
jgi:FMN reductase